MTGDLLLALDAGGSYVKATLFDPAAGTSRTVGRAVDLVRPRPGFTERDAELLWSATCRCIADLVADLDGGPGRIGVVGLTGHGNGLYLVDAAGRPTANAIMAADGRAGELVGAWLRDGVEDAVRGQAWNGVWAGKPGPLLAWLDRHDPDVLDRTHAVLSCKDYLRARLTGAVSTEVTDATAGGLYDNSALLADPGATLSASDGTLRAYGIEHRRGLLRETVDSTAEYGVSTEGAAATGLRPGTPVVAGLVDNAAMQHGSGVFDSGAVCVGAGTWSINQLLVPLEQMTMDGALGSVRPYASNSALNGLGLLCEASATSASNFAWALERVLTGASGADRAAGSDVFEARLERERERSRRVDDPMFFPFIDGSRDDSAARGAWLGLSSANGEDDVLGAVLEGICFEHRRHVERLERTLPRPLPVRLSGGASRSPVWCRLFADVLARPVQVSSVTELGSLCVAALAGAGSGVFRTVEEGVARLSPRWSTFEPDERLAEHFDRRWRTYQTWASQLGRLHWGVDA